MKKIVSLLLALTMVIGMMSFASADNVTNLVTISLAASPSAMMTSSKLPTSTPPKSMA